MERTRFCGITFLMGWFVRLVGESVSHLHGLKSGSADCARTVKSGCLLKSPRTRDRDRLIVFLKMHLPMNTWKKKTMWFFTHIIKYSLAVGHACFWRVKNLPAARAVSPRPIAIPKPHIPFLKPSLKVPAHTSIAFCISLVFISILASATETNRVRGKFNCLYWLTHTHVSFLLYNLGITNKNNISIVWDLVILIFSY